MLRTLFIALALLGLAACNGTGESDLDRLAQDVPPDNNGSDGCENSKSAELSAEEYYASDVYPILEADCMSCHQTGGNAGYTDFILSGDSDADLEVVVESMERTVGGMPYLLAKATGFAGHTGGARFAPSSAEAQAISRFGELLNDEGSAETCEDDDRVKDGFLKGVTLLTPEETLHKAATVMLGRKASHREMNILGDGSAEALRAALR